MAGAKKEVTAVDILKHARALLAKRGGWTKGVYARESPNGAKVNFTDQEATCFCADGALMRASSDLGGESTRAHYHAAFVAVSGFAGGNIISFNDSAMSKTPVLKAFDRAIAKLEAKNA